MLSTVQKTEKNIAFLEIEIEKEKVSSAFQKTYQDLLKKVRISGFRPGKIPKNVLLNFVGKETIEQGVIEILIPEAISLSLKENNIDAISYPKITQIGEIKEGMPFKFSMEVEVKPEVNLPFYRGLVLKKKRQDITDIHIDKHLYFLREKKAMLVPVEDRGITSGDVVVINYYATCDGKDFSNNKGEGVQIEIGSGNFLKEVEDNLLGLNKGDEKDIVVKISEDHPNKEIAGKDINFKVKVVSIKQKQLPDITSEFASEFGCNTISELREEIRKSLEEDLKRKERDDFKNQIIDILSDATKIDVPTSLVNYEKERLINNLIQNLRLNGLNPDDYIADGRLKDEEKQKDIENQAEKNAKKYLILDSISKKENISVTEEEVQEEIEKIARHMNVDVQKVKKYFEEQGKISSIEENIRHEKVFDLIIDSAKFLYVEEEEK